MLSYVDSKQPVVIPRGWILTAASQKLLSKVFSLLESALTSRSSGHNAAVLSLLSRVVRAIKPSHVVRSIAAGSSPWLHVLVSIPNLIFTKMAVLSIDINAIIGMLTLLVTCIQAIWFLLRLKDRRQKLRQRRIEEPETGFSQTVCTNVSTDHSLILSLRFCFVTVLILVFLALLPPSLPPFLSFSLSLCLSLVFSDLYSEPVCSFQLII